MDKRLNMNPKRTEAPIRTVALHKNEKGSAKFSFWCFKLKKWIEIRKEGRAKLRKEKCRKPITFESFQLFMMAILGPKTMIKGLITPVFGALGLNNQWGNLARPRHISSGSSLRSFRFLRAGKD